MPVTKGALLHQIVQRVEELERRVAALESGAPLEQTRRPAKKAAARNEK